MTTAEAHRGDLPFFLTDASFWFPQDIVDSAWLQNAPFAFWIVDVTRPKALVELGTHTGFSYLCFCQAVDRLALGSSCSAIDTWTGDEHAGFYDEQVLTALRNLHDRRYGTFSRLVQSTFDEAVSHFGDASIDLLHIDGRHFYEDVKHDFHTWLPKLSSRAVVLMHDINVKERDFGVDKLWGEIVREYPTFELRDEHGLGVVAVGDDQPQPIRLLMQAGTDESLAMRIRTTYQRLGSSVSMASRIRLLEGGIVSLTAKTSDLDRVLDEVTELREALRQADQQSQSDALRLHEALTDNGLLRAEVSRAQEELAQVAAIAEARAAEVTQVAAIAEARAAEVTQGLAVAEARAAELAQVLAVADARAAEASELERHLEATLQRLNEIYASKAWKVASLRWRLSSRTPSV